MARILVTGATGTFGGLLAERLRRTGEDVRVMVRDPAKLPIEGCDVAIGDFADRSRLAAAMAGIERLFLASFDTGDFVALQKTVIDVARQQGVRHIARISTMFLDEPKFAAFMDAAIAGERQLEDSGIAFTHLRPSWVLQNFLPTSAATPVIEDRIRLPAGDGRVGFVDARDVAAVAAKALTESGHENQAYELTGPAARTHEDLANALSLAIGRTIVFEDLPPERYAQGLAKSGWPPKSVATMGLLFEHVRNGEAAVLTDDVERVTGQPPLSIEDFARDHAHLY